MIFASPLLLSFRHPVLLIFIGGLAIFGLFQTSIRIIAGQYIPLVPRPKPPTPSDPSKSNETLGVATKIYVISLPHRTDRRSQMDQLRQTLGLKWTYIEGMDMNNEIIDKIVNSVRSIRAANASDSSFIWPLDLPSSDEWIDPWSPGFLTAHEPFYSSEPMLCATNNNTVVPYDRNAEPPEYRILTRARIACWYTHLSVIQGIANDSELKDDDAVIVLEDDIDMERDILDRLKYLWAFLPFDWDMVYLGEL
jgi:GR25 family glycosyltransferase involved in LPS biosynthesis